MGTILDDGGQEADARVGRFGRGLRPSVILGTVSLGFAIAVLSAVSPGAWPFATATATVRRTHDRVQEAAHV